jgi:hypothetical protein
VSAIPPVERPPAPRRRAGSPVRTDTLAQMAGIDNDYFAAIAARFTVEAVAGGRE